jgi:hypothetical protein
MTLNLAEVKRIAAEVARTENPTVEVVSATTAEGGSGYTEVTIVIHGCHKEPCRIIIGADRSGGESALRSAIASQLRAHLDQRQP